VALWPAAVSTTVERTLAHGTVRVYPGQAETIVEALDRAAADHPARPAVGEAGGEPLTHDQFRERSAGVAAVLQARYGVGAGDRVAILAANGIDFLLAFVGALRAGAVAVPLNTKYRTPELARQLAQSGARVLLAEEEFWPKAEPVAPEHAALAGEFRNWRGEPAPPAIGAEDPAVLMYTSGTTGFSKGALQSHLNVVTAAENYRRHFGLAPEDTTLVAAPLFHATAWHGQLFPLLTAGGSGTILPRFDARAASELLAGGTATFFHAAPTIYVMTLAEAAGRTAPSLRAAVAGGSLVTRGLVAGLRAFAPGADFRISYGMTETSSPAVFTPPGWIETRPGDAVGVAVPVCDVAVSGDGEILFRGATVIAGYDRDPDANARSFTEDGWLRSGDIGEIDEQGFVFVLDRLKDIINRGAEKISSLEVEGVLLDHPAVLEAAVVAEPDEVYGEVPRAVVVAEGVTADELRDYALARLAAFKVPAAYEFVTELPRNPGGKVLKQELRRTGAASPSAE
jgi:long-chain acyl-CoA synthetase